MVNNSLEQECFYKPKSLVLVAYCRYNNKFTAEQIYGAITRQIADSTKDEEVLDHLRSFYAKHKLQNTTPHVSDFVRLFDEVFPLYDQVVISLDAIDEASDEVKEELLSGLSQVEAILFITSRPSADLYKDMLDGVYSLRLETSSINTDIQHFIWTKMTTIPRLKLILGKKPGLLKTICETLYVKCAGMSVTNVFFARPPRIHY